MNKKTSKPPVDLPGGFVDRKEKELVIRDFLIKQIKEVMTKYGFEFLETPSFEYTESLGKFYQIKIDLLKECSLLKTVRNGYL